MYTYNLKYLTGNAKIVSIYLMKKERKSYKIREMSKWFSVVLI